MQHVRCKRETVGWGVEVRSPSLDIVDRFEAHTSHETTKWVGTLLTQSEQETR